MGVVNLGILFKSILVRLSYLYPMKILLLLLTLMVCLSLSGHAQSIPQGATGIDVQTSMADSTLYNAVQGFLETQEYVIEETDAARYTLTTEQKEELTGIQIRVLATVENGVAHFTAEGTLPLDGAASGEPFVYEDDSKVGFMILNRLVDQFAKAFDLATVEYVVP